MPLLHLHVDGSSVRHDENNGAENVTGHAKDICIYADICYYVGIAGSLFLYVHDSRH